jgi:N-acetylneuraminic acid mutarotase
MMNQTDRFGGQTTDRNSSQDAEGGRSSFSPANHHRDGFIYDPRLDRWRPMSMEGAPSGRSQMAAAWTGQELLVWGGWSDQGLCPNTGGAYNPRTDSWRELPVAGAPIGRIEPACIWTGREMIVWGGLLAGERHATATGARFDPEKQQWTPLPEKDAPPPLRGHQAVWTGEDMIVWGGANLDESWPVNRGLNVGARYSPARNAWSELPRAAAIQGRIYHCAAWTGSEVLIWGGGDQENGLASTGASLDPEHAVWKIVDSTDGPAPRSLATAVWAGNGLLIYGGSTGGSSAFDDLYFLQPAQ